MEKTNTQDQYAISEEPICPFTKEPCNRSCALNNNDVDLLFDSCTILESARYLFDIADSLGKVEKHLSYIRTAMPEYPFRS